MIWQSSQTPSIYSSDQVPGKEQYWGSFHALYIVIFNSVYQSGIKTFFARDPDSVNIGNDEMTKKGSWHKSPDCKVCTVHARMCAVED